MLTKIKKYFDHIRIIYSKLLFAISGKEKNNSYKINNLKNKYAGKRCFIVCNGPSLKAEDLDKIHLNNDFSFASNKIDKIFNKTQWRPTFYTITDEGYKYTLLNTMNSIPAKIKFFRKTSYSTTRHVKGNVIWINVDGNRNLLKHPNFSENSTNIVYGIATVTYVMIQLAVHMGFRELYIIGCDNSYGLEIKEDGSIVDNGTNSYFSGSDSKDNRCVGATWEMNIAYSFARKYADTHGIIIKNATRGGHLEAFERIDFDTLF